MRLQNHAKAQKRVSDTITGTPGHTSRRLIGAAAADTDTCLNRPKVPQVIQPDVLNLNLLPRWKRLLERWKFWYCMCIFIPIAYRKFRFVQTVICSVRSPVPTQPVQSRTFVNLASTSNTIVRREKLQLISNRTFLLTVSHLYHWLVFMINI